MRKRVRFPKDNLRKSLAFLMLLCMMIGSIYIPVMAEEENGNKLQEVESGESNPEDLKNNNTKDKEEQPEDSKDDKEEEDNEPDEKEPDLNEEEPDEKKPDVEDDLDSKELEPGEELDEKEQEELEGEIDKEVSKQEIKEEQKDNKLEMPEIINVVVPGSYILALNPYGLPIRIGEDEVTTRQVISGNYGIINKSSVDQIVMVSLVVEDLNDGELVFVGSEEEALNAEEGVYAVYLAAVPAGGEEILAGGLPVNESTTREDLQNVKMTAAQEQAVTLCGGANQIAFKLSGAVYRYESPEYEEEFEPKDLEDGLREEPEIFFDGLAPDGTGITAYTFYGAMNPDAPWEELSGGIKISVVYTYWTADGNEEIIEGTGAMISLD